MQNIGKICRSAVLDGKPIRDALNEFLRNYRATPHPSTGVAPNDLFFGRSLSCRLPGPVVDDTRVSELLSGVRLHDSAAKEKSKHNKNAYYL